MLLLAVGLILIIARMRPASDFYFPFVWLGYIFLLDGAVTAQGGSSLMLDRPAFLAMFPISVAFWWIFELFNQAVHNWVYIGAENYVGPGFVVFASLDFSTVLPAVWVTARFMDQLLPAGGQGRRHVAVVPTSVSGTMLFCGLACMVLPIVFPRYAFACVWLCLFLVLDPINYWLGRPSVVAYLWRRAWRLPLCFALGSLMCGVFWEAWNFWSMPKWIYAIPYVYHWKIFEMPLLGWSGYLPFGLELFAMTVFVFASFGLPLPAALLNQDLSRSTAQERQVS